MTAREWDRPEFRAAYERYRAYYRWMKDDVRGNPNEEAMLKRYAKDERLREELRVMYEVTRILNERGAKLSQVVRVDVSEDGHVTIDAGG